MEIDGVNPHSALANQLMNLHRKGPKAAEGSDPAPDDEGLLGPASAENESTVEQTGESTDADGVIRLLQEGHFKGVSDLRLRINFFDQLSAIEAQQLQAVAEEKVDGILQAVGSVIESLPEEPPDEEPQLPEALVVTLSEVTKPPAEFVPEPPIDEPQLPKALFATLTEVTKPLIEQAPEPAVDVLQLQETFTRTVNQLKEDFLAAQSPTTDTLLEGIQTAFDQLIESLQTALAPPEGPAEPLSNEAPPAPPPDVSLANEEGGLIDPPPGPDSAPETPAIIEELTAAFESAMDELIDGFSAVTILSPSSQPAGNGSAYAKFLNIYNQMREIETSDSSPQASQLLEV